MTFTQILGIVIGVCVVAWIIDNMFGGGGSSSGGHTIGDLRKTIKNI